MCGIVGLVYQDPARSPDPVLLKRMCAAIRYRGPDDEGYHVAGQAGIGMRRLSIIDVDGGHQPVLNERGSCAIVFNGEIYNYRELRRDLLSRGHVLRTAGDTEPIIHLYEERGPDCVSALRGMFAFAIWDEDKRTLLLARDRFGIKPLYYVTGPWGIAFASELKALLAAGLTSRELDWTSLDAFVQLGYIPAPRTPFADVRKLEPAHRLRWHDGGEIVVEPYWDLPRQRVAESPNLERQVLEWLDESVDAHLVSDVPVAAFLSGGLDSSAVLASVATVRPGGIPHVFTGRYMGTDATQADETTLARTLAARYGARLTVVDITPDIRETFEPIVRALDEPHADDSAVPTWMLSQAVGQSYKVALTGIGGDELFAGYRRHVGLLVSERYGRLPSSARVLVAGLGERLPDSWGRELTIDRLKRFLKADGSTAGRYFDLLSRASASLRDQLYAADLRASVRDAAGAADGAGGKYRNAARRRFEELYERAGSPAGLNAALTLDYKTFLADDVLALSDRLSMAHSLEIRVPMVDHELVERVFPLSSSVKVGRWRWQLKRLLKRALASRLPVEHLRAPKRGFVGPTAAWLRNELRALVTDELSPGRMRRLGYFDPKAVDDLLKAHFTRRHNREGVLWGLLCFSTWHRLFLENAPVLPPATIPTSTDRQPASAASRR